jgi:hypothetical protein
MKKSLKLDSRHVVTFFLVLLVTFLGTSCISTDPEQRERERVERDVKRRTKQILDYGGTIKTEKEARRRAKSEAWEKDFFRKMRSRNYN